MGLPFLSSASLSHQPYLALRSAQPFNAVLRYKHIFLQADVSAAFDRSAQFERAVFEYHLENQTPYNVLLSQLGRFRYAEKYGGK
jgi:hypothetical protein